MTELRPCPACKRHVAVREITCPFCAIALAPGRAQFVMPRGRITRAAIFSAALVACEGKQAETPKTTPAQTGSAAASDDLEKLLDGDQGVVQRGMPMVAAPADAAAMMIAATIDAGVPDAGIDQQALAERKRQQALAQRKRLLEERKRRELERQRIEQERLDRQMRDMHQHAKPYGAPPARKRVV